MGCWFAFLGHELSGWLGYAGLFAVAVGALVIAGLLLRLLGFIYAQLLRGSKLSKYLRKDSWAVVTGATDGIGKAFALQLAKKGFNVLLVSRTKERLEETKAAVEKLGVKSEYVTVNFETATEVDYGNIAAALKGKTATVLVNNVGVGYDFPMFHHEVDVPTLRRIIELNIYAATRLTNDVIPIMQSQKLGLVLNISSASGALTTTPQLTVYAASKAYINSWSNSLVDEYKRDNIHFESLTPFYVTSKLSKLRNASLTTPNPDTYVRSVLGHAGYERVHTGYWVHEIMLWGSRLLPISTFGARTLAMHNAIRKRGLAKRAEKSK
jgi:17beta-estradiol 17-dehydrogenase / very-long-chain 3-oxoacyl-CoA reductase